MRHFLLVIMAILAAAMPMSISAQAVRNSNYSTVGYVRSDGRVENSNHSCLGYVEGMSREWAAAFFFFFFN